MSLAHAVADVGALLDSVTVDHVPTIILREDGEAVVVVSVAAWNRLQERIGGETVTVEEERSNA